MFKNDSEFSTSEQMSQKSGNSLNPYSDELIQFCSVVLPFQNNLTYIWSNGCDGKCKGNYSSQLH